MSGSIAAAAAATLVAVPLTSARGLPAPEQRAPAYTLQTGAARDVAATGPIRPTVRSYRVGGVSREAAARLRGLRSGQGSTLAALSEPEPASGFAVAGATWTGSAPQGIKLAVRTATEGAWSSWAPLAYDAEHGPDPDSSEGQHARPGTDPFVVGDVDAVQLRVTSPTGTAPAGLALSIVDPGTAADAEPAPARAAAVSPGAAASPGAALTAPVDAPGATPRPTIYSRADWGADERMRDCCIEYGEVHAGFVHHTVNANDYSRADVPAILRGIYAYHTQSRGWRDIGYNFLIDKFGRIWEGRAGGITLPVVGAHTLNYNENSFAASAIGNYETARPTAAMLDAYARLYAWKLSLHGVRPDTRQVVAGTTFNAISGHRDAAATACPGRYLYAQIPRIISDATRYQQPFLGRDLQRSFVRDARPDVLLASPVDGRLAVSRGTGAPGVDGQRVVVSGFGGMDEITPVGDVTGDRLRDLMARDPATGSTRVYPGRGDGTFGTPVGESHRWATSDLFAGPADLDGDGRNDVVARDAASGALKFYPGRGTGTFGVGRVAIADFSRFNRVNSAGDFNGDGHEDLLALGVRGRLWVFFGDGTGVFPTTSAVRRGWGGMDAITGGGDLTGDGRPDVVARDAATHQVRIYANIDGTRLSPAIGNPRLPLSSLRLSHDLTGDRRPDFVGVDSKGSLVVAPSRQQNWLAPLRVRQSWPGMDRVFVVGDWNGDGYVDAMARERATGKMWLFPGASTGRLGAAVGGWGDWRDRSLITPVGDFDGDGRPDLMARPSDGHVYLYPGRGGGGFGARVIIRSSLPSGATIIPVGLWDNDGAPDVLVRSGTGQLLLYPGNGPGGLDDPVSLGTGFDRYSTLVGVGDLTADGQADLLGRTSSGDVWLLPGAVPTKTSRGGSVGPPQYVAWGWSGYQIG